MNLINPRTLSEKIQNFIVPEDVSLNIKNTCIRWDNEKNLQEIQHQQNFLQDFFCEILGYTGQTGNKNNTIWWETGTNDGTRPDGILGFISEKYIKAVIELKGSNINLDKRQFDKSNYKETPIKQAFSYAPAVGGKCEFVIVSNFREIRLYKSNDSSKYQKFEIKDLINNLDNQKEFYFLFCQKNLIGEINEKSLVSKLLEEEIKREEDIKERFYIEYKILREELVKNIIQNDNLSVDTAVNKAQKLFDRIIFIRFCEDNNLINKPFENLDAAKKLGFDLWISLKQLFISMDKGNLPYIHQFNGGLFELDEIFDNLQIKNTLLEKVIKFFRKYHFKYELSVNILGHIFEKSITDLELLKKQLKNENTIIARKEKDRNKQGIFYTPENITEYIIEKVIGGWLTERKRELGLFETVNLNQKELLQKYKIYSQVLKNIRILDPACGSGAFLVGAFSFLQKEWAELQNIIRDLGGNFLDFEWNYTNLLKNNIYGIDLNPESVEITKLSLWLKTANKQDKLTNLDENIICANSLLSPLSTILQSFNIIIGNPPYGSHLDEKSKESLHKIYPNVPDYEIYMYFLRKGLDLLDENGILSYIFPNTFLSINNGAGLREWILENFDILQITDLSNDKTFKDARVRTCIFTVRKRKTENNITEFWEIISNEKEFKKKSEFNRSFLKENIANWLTIFSYSKENQQIINKMKAGQKIADICEISQGLIPYDKYRGHDEFTIKNRIWHTDNKKDETYKRELKGADIEKYSINWNGELWISYGDWLAAPRKQVFFTNPRVLIREIAENTLNCAYSEEEFYNTPSIINIIHPENNKNVLKFILGVLNTKLIGWYHQNTSPKAKKGLFPKILVNDVRNLPIPNASSTQQNQIAELVDKIMKLKNEMQKHKQKALKTFERECRPKALTKKIQEFWKFDFKDFIKEIEKQKVSLSLKNKEELEEYFENKKADLIDLENQVSEINSEIETLVGVLYGV